MTATVQISPGFDYVEMPPTQDELPYSDGVPLETFQHFLQIVLLVQSLRLHWAERRNWFAAGDMFIYFSLAQARNQDFRGPDFFLVLDVDDAGDRVRKSWVVWEEGKAPDLVIELLSPSTAQIDKGEKKLVYQDQMRVPEYFWYDIFSGEFAGFALRDGLYEPLQPDAQGGLSSVVTELRLVPQADASWFSGASARWLRWATPDGTILLTPEEREAKTAARAEQAESRVEQAESRAEQAESEIAAERERAEAALRRIAELEARLNQAPERQDDTPA